MHANLVQCGCYLHMLCIYSIRYTVYFGLGHCYGQVLLWHTAVMGESFSGTLLLWASPSLVHYCYGQVLLWHTTVMNKSFSGTLLLWASLSLAHYCYGRVFLWHTTVMGKSISGTKSYFKLDVLYATSCILEFEVHSLCNYICI